MKHEVQAYIRDASANGDTTDPLLWWRVNRKQYPRISLAARKWLSVCSTSTPSERVFSICGIVDLAKRNRMNGNAIAAQVFLYSNNRLYQLFCRRLNLLTLRFYLES